MGKMHSRKVSQSAKEKQINLEFGLIFVKIPVLIKNVYLFILKAETERIEEISF